MSLAREGVAVTINARTAETLEATADEIRAVTGSSVTAVVCDITSDEGRARTLEACPDPDILVNNAGGPPPGDFRDWDQEVWFKALNANMLTPIFLIKATVDKMIDQGFGRIVNITSGAVKSPIPVLGLSNGARAGLTGFVAGVARETVRNNVTINNLLPGSFATDRIMDTIRAEAEREGTTVEEMKENRAQRNPAGRIGDPIEFGEACAFLCGVNAGFITGQNLLIDGGAFRGTL
jgi:3-oxoacyl-[acyl-carrier protein] reductase